MRISLLLLALLACPLRAHAALTPNGELALEKGLHHLYNLDYIQARADFHKLIEQEPENPFGYLFESASIWWQSSQEFGLFKDTPTLQGLFEKDVEIAIKKADAMTDSSDLTTKVDGNFALGMSLGTRGQWGLMRHHWLKAYFDGKHAIKHLKKCLKLDEHYYDASLGLGVFDYQAAQLGGVLKFTSILGGMHGDEKRGLENIWLAVEKGPHSSAQAADMLTSIYIADKHDYAKALQVLGRLRKTFPESVYFQFLELALRHIQGDAAGSLADGHELFEKIQADPKAFQPKLLSLICGMTDVRCLAQTHVTAAQSWLTQAIESTPEPIPAPKPAKGKHAKASAAAALEKAAAAKVESDRLAWVSTLRLYRGYAFDLLKKRDDALADYAWVLSHQDFSDNHARAQVFTEKAADRDALLAYFREMSKEASLPPEQPETKP